MVYSSAAAGPPQLDRVFHALADPTRRAILQSVAEDARTVSQIAEPFSMSLAAVSKHLKVLESADLIAREKRGSFQFIRTNAGPMKQAQQWLSHYERFWSDRLDKLEAAFRHRKNRSKSRLQAPAPIKGVAHDDTLHMDD